MAAPAHKVLDDTVVSWNGDEEPGITVGTPAWFDWLGQTATFSFSCAQGSFTARKERLQRGGWYWKAYRSRFGKVHHAYLGKTEALSLERLLAVAARLTERTLHEAPPFDRRSLPAGGLPLADPHEHSIRQGPAMPPAPLPPSSVLRTKICLPSARSPLVDRPRLTDRMEELVQHKVMLISAPAGSGKTTLLTQWSMTGLCPIAWVTLDAADNDPLRFWECVDAAIRTLRPDLGSEWLATLHASPARFSESTLTALINAVAALPGHLALVLDDYHVIADAAIHQAVAFLVDHLPPQLHLVISSRTDPPFPLARLRTANQLIELRAADLSFNSAETVAFLNGIMHLNLPLEHADALGRRTEGWIAGLQLAALSLRGSKDPQGFVTAFAGEHAHVFDFLVEEVLRLQTPEVQRFLLQTSILDQLSGSLCDAVTGERGGQAMLEALERANLFTISLDDERRWYRYHHLFADFLRACLHRARPREVSGLHRHASAWYLANGPVGEAVDHALAAGDFALAVRLIEDTAVPILQRSEVSKTLGWLNRLPEDLVRSRPALCVVHAWALATGNQVDAAEARVRDAERGLSRRDQVVSGPRGRLTAQQAERLLGEMDAIRAQVAFVRGDLPLAIALGRRALSSPIGADTGLRSVVMRNLATAYWRTGDVREANQVLAEVSVTSQMFGYTVNAIGALNQLASLQVVEGQLREANQTYRRALELAARQDSDAFSIAGWPYVGLGRLLYEWNDLAAAASYVAKGLELAKRAGMPDIAISAYGGLARISQARGDPERAFEMIDLAEQLAAESHLPLEVERLSAYRARLWLAQGNVEIAARWAQQSGLRATGGVSYSREGEHLMLARVLIAQRQAARALHLLERLGRAAEAAGRMGSLVKVLILEATAFQTEGDATAALDRLERALLLGEPERYVRSFVDAGPPLRALLTRLPEARRRAHHPLRQRTSLAYLRTLLAAFQAGPGPLPTDERLPASQRLLDPLSEREVEVLHLLAAGRSSLDIARELLVSANTVKTHVKNVYGKLGVHSAGEAVGKAKDLGLL